MMKFSALLVTSVSLCAVATVSAFAAVPAHKSAAHESSAAAPPPVATYWMDVSTMSGFGAGMMGAMGGGGRPSLGQMMSMMNGGGNSVAHMLSLKLSSRDRPTAAPEANHFIPAGMQMGASLPLVTPPPPKQHSGTSSPSEPGSYEKPQGRILIYWGCGEHAGAGQPMVIDFSKMAEGQIPPGLEALAKMGRAMGRMQMHEPTRDTSPGFGEWPNTKDSRLVPASASLMGAHRVEGNYSPAMAFTLGQGQDFMPGLGLHEAGVMPSGADRLDWTPAAQATGYALALFGQGNGGDMVIWTSGKGASMFPAFDYQSPAQVREMIAAGAALPPSTSECLLPSEVSRAVPHGMVMGIGYGPEAYFADKPHAPIWTARVRYKTTDMLMRGMGAEMGRAGNGDQQAQGQPPEQKKKRHGFGLGDILQGAVPH
jgi:hypothetical protein